MKNIDALIYTKNVINILVESGFFNDIDPFVEEEPLYNEILSVANQNIIDFEDPTLSDVQFKAAISDVRLRAISETFDGLVDKGKLKIDGIDKNGDFLYAINEN